MMDDVRFVEIATGHVSNRGHVTTVDNIHSYISNKNQKTETYHSWFAFDGDLKRHIRETGSIANFDGVYYIHSIILDFDIKELTNQQLYEAVHWMVNEDMINDLLIKPEHIRIWYSGTGFHIELPNLFGFEPSTELPHIVKATLSALFPDCDTIYDGARLIRAGHSYNEKNDNFKVPFTVESFNKASMDEIILISKQLTDELSLFDNIAFYDVEPYLEKYIVQPELSENKTIVRKRFKIDPSRNVTCMQTLISKPPPVGQRNHSMMRVASWLRRCGVPQLAVQGMLTQWTGLDKEAISTANQVFTEEYEYGCEDPIMTEYCSSRCLHFRHKDYNMKIKNVEDMALDYAEFVKQDFTEHGMNLRDAYSMEDDYWILPGELVIVSGNTGLGKSTFVMNLVTKFPKLKTLFMSLENNWHLTYRRFVQMTHGLTKEQAIEEYRRQEHPPMHYEEAFKHISIVCESPELSTMMKTIAMSSVKVVVVDPTDMINVRGTRDDYSAMTAIIRGLKNFAEAQQIIIIAVHHVNKEALVNNRTDIGSLKGTSDVSQKADKVITINGDRDNVRRVVQANKSRDEDNRLMKIMFEFRKKTMQFVEIPNFELEPNV